MNLKISIILLVLFVGISWVYTSADVIDGDTLEKNKQDTTIVVKQAVIKRNQTVNKSTIVENISNDHNPDFILSPFIKYEVTQDVLSGLNHFSNQPKMVEFKVSPRAYLKVNTHGTMTFNNHTKLHITANSIFELEDSSTLFIRNGSKIELDSGATLLVRGSGKIFCEDSSEIIINGFSNIILKQKNSSINMNKGSKFSTQNGLAISYLGEGCIYIDNKLYRSVNNR